ncbi:MAG: helix-turn-helix domain-containing protein [Prevotella sp.]|nr:helix-turn-helix domain-containing protein [Candidatus Prevotella equi]
MAQIKNQAAYKAALKRIDELLPLVTDNTPTDDPNYLELDMISDMVEEYEDIHYPISTPSLVDVIKLRMYERNLTIDGVAELLGIGKGTINDIFSGKTEPGLNVGRLISQRLSIDPAVVLGV